MKTDYRQYRVTRDHLYLLVLLTVAGVCGGASGTLQPSRYFAIEVVDDQTGRGVPMVELQTTSSARYYTDSSGLIAFDEPGLMDQKVWFAVAAHGYEFPPDGFGIRGVTLVTKPGASAKLKIKRLNIAERLYRITGQGIYRDTVLLGRKPPIAQPLLNAQVTGQDGILTAVYRGRLYWLYGDTCRLSYALGGFAMTGAVTELPEKIDPAVGVDLRYFTGPDGFARSMAPMKGEGVVWLAGLVVLPDEAGQERMLAWFQRRQGLGPVLENGFVVYNDEKDVFEKHKVVDLNPSLIPTGYPLRQAGRWSRVHLLHRPLPGGSRPGRLEVLSRSVVLRRLHVLGTRHPLRRQGQSPARPRQGWQAPLGMEEGHAAAESQGPGGPDRRRQNETRGVSAASASLPLRQAQGGL